MSSISALYGQWRQHLDVEHCKIVEYRSADCSKQCCMPKVVQSVLHNTWLKRARPPRLEEHTACHSLHLVEHTLMKSAYSSSSFCIRTNSFAYPYVGWYAMSQSTEVVF